MQFIDDTALIEIIYNIMSCFSAYLGQTYLLLALENRLLQIVVLRCNVLHLLL